MSVSSPILYPNSPINSFIMGRIKSALEIAMERTESVKGDKTSIGLFDAKQRGKRLANQFLAGDISDLQVEFKKAASADERQALQDGSFDVFITQITLPGTNEDLQRLEKLGAGLAFVIKNKNFSLLYRQFMAAVSQYLQEAAQYEEAIKQQYEPRLRQKEEELARRLGQQIKLDPFQDPEFVAFYNQHINALKSNYEALITETKEQVTGMRNEE